MTNHDESHFNHLRAEETLNAIQAKIVAANFADNTSQAAHHHIMSAKFHLREMAHARTSQQPEMHHLAGKSYGAHLTSLMDTLNRSGTQHGESIGDEVDSLLAGSHALSYE